MTTLEEIEDLNELREVLLNDTKYKVNQIEKILTNHNEDKLSGDDYKNDYGQATTDDICIALFDFACHIKYDTIHNIQNNLPSTLEGRNKGLYIDKLKNTFNKKTAILTDIENCNKTYNQYKGCKIYNFKDSEFLLNIQNKELWNKAMEHYMVKDKKLSINQFITLIKNMAITF